MSIRAKNMLCRCLWTAIVTVGFLVAPAGVRSQDSGGIGQFAWMIGTWAGEEEGGMLYESWSVVDEETMIGEGYLLYGADTVLRENLQIRRFGRHWTYVAVINGGRPTMFTLISSDDGNLVFENPEHDFPQRIVYTQPDENRLLAWIEGTMKGEAMRDEYALRRVDAD